MLFRSATGSFKSTISRVRTAADAASFFAPLAKKAKENVMMLVLDKNAKPIALVDVSTGILNQSYLIPRNTVGVAMNMPGASSVWFAHNHPSGDVTNSKEDKQVEQRFNELMGGSGLTVDGFMTIGRDGEFYASDYGHGVMSVGGKHGKVIPVLDQTIEKLVDKNAARVTGPEMLSDQIGAVGMDGKNGVVLLDSKNRIVGTVELSVADMEQLRTDSRDTGSGLLMRVLSLSNAAAMVVVTNQHNAASYKAVSNMNSFGKSFGISVLDAMTANGSMMEAGLSVPENAGGSFYSVSLNQSPATGLNAADLQREFDGVPFKSKIKVVQTAEELPGFGRKSLFSKMVEGQYKDGTIYLVAGNLTSVERARIVALGHELTHAGQNTKLVNLAVQWFREAQAKGENGSRFQQAAMKILKEEAGKRGYDIREEADFVKAVKEATAVIAEYAYKNGDTSGLMTRLLIYLKHWLRKQGIAIKYSDKELLSTVTMMMRQGEKNLTNSTGPDGGQFSTVAPEDGKEYDKGNQGGVSNENISKQSNRVTGQTGVFRSGLRATSRATAGLTGTKYYEAETEALKRFADRYEYGQDFDKFNDAYKEQTASKGKIEGVEHDVVLKPDQGIVIKRKNLGVDIQEYLQRIIDHNELFPETAYELEGISERSAGGSASLYMTVVQPYFKNRTDENGKTIPITSAELIAAMKEKGFEPLGETSEKAFERGWAVFMNAAGDMVSDLAPRNVIIDQTGTVYVIDPQVHRATESDTSFSIASPTLSHAQDIMQDLWNDASGSNLLKSMAKTINPFDYSRSSQWFDRVLPESVKNTISYLFRTPVNQAAVDPDKQPFVDAALEREETKIGFNLALKGWDGKTKSTTFFGRMKEAVTQWENHDKATAWGRIQDEFVKLSREQQDAVNTLLDQGDYRYTVYKTIDGALKNKQIAMRKPTAEAFALYQKVRHHIDVVVAHERERIFIEMAREAGLSKPEIEKHIADYRNSLAQRPGWLPRNHGSGKHQANVYHIIEALEFDQRDVAGGRKQAFLPYYAGPDVTKALVKLVDEINKKYGDDQKDNRLKFASVAGTNLLPNGQMSITGQAEDIATLLQQAEGILPDLKKKHAARLSQLQEARSLASENNATKAELRRLDQSIKDMGDGTIKVKVYMSLLESKYGAEKSVQRLEKDLKKEMPKNFKPGRKYEINYAFADHLDEDTFGDLTGDLAMERAQLEALKKARQSGEVTREEADEMKKAIIKTSAETLMGRGAGRHQIERAPYLIEGYTNDNSLQAYTDYMDSTAGMLSKAMYAREQFDNLRYAKPEVKKWADTYITDTLKNQDRKSVV